ncbi:MAG: hypothetical protein ETSY1_11900 [Candidatus Entotheonella factor]|uniref:DICT domain-containing protein n=1 Tax=Entotheonella factor TaxID=1429438 RepID=W4LQC9_ENTF1|nr:MAG: hypothetical protein ETSY1_11900 [Candidatus Entotheonella factor]
MDPNFNLYSLAESWNLRQITGFYRGTLRTLSYEFENAILQGNIQGRLFAGFQKMSYFLTRLDRYSQLAQVVGQIWIFGIPDVDLPQSIEGITFVPLREHDRLVKEWFLVIDSPVFFFGFGGQRTHDL